MIFDPISWLFIKGWRGSFQPYAFWALHHVYKKFWSWKYHHCHSAELSKVIGIQVKKLGGVLNELEQQEILR